MKKMQWQLIKFNTKEEAKSIDILSSFGVENPSQKLYCCCDSCVKEWGHPNKGGEKQLSRFLKLLHKYYDRFEQEPTFELAQSLFDDCFKNTVTGSE